MAYEHNGEDGVFTESVLAATAEPEDDLEEVAYEPFAEGEDPLEAAGTRTCSPTWTSAEDEPQPEPSAPGVRRHRRHATTTSRPGSRSWRRRRASSRPPRSRARAGACGARSARPRRARARSASCRSCSSSRARSTSRPRWPRPRPRVAAIVGAFTAGWATPEREPPLPPTSAHALLDLGR